VDTDAFQGREKNLVVLSLVRIENVGFFADLRRTNLAVTRFQQKLCIVGNIQFWKQKPRESPLIAALAELAIKAGVVKVIDKQGLLQNESVGSVSIRSVTTEGRDGNCPVRLFAV